MRNHLDFCKLTFLLLASVTFALLGTLNQATVIGDEFTGNLLVQSQTPGQGSFRIREYDSSGNVLQSIVPPLPPNSSDLLHPRDLIIGGSGDMHLFNGTFDPYLSTYDASGGVWSHRTHGGWTTVNNVSYGGIGQFGDNVFVTNMSTAGNPSSGVVAFNLTNGSSADVISSLQAIDLTIGLDDSLWVLSGSTAFEFDPVTFAAGNVVSMSNAGGDIRSIAVDANGHFYVGTWDGAVSKLSADGVLLDSLAVGFSVIDVDVSATGQLAFGTRLNGTWLTNTDLDPALQIESDRWNSFVTFVPSSSIPEPSITSILAMLLLAVSGRRRRKHPFSKT